MVQFKMAGSWHFAPYFFKILFSIILSLTPRSPTFFLPAFRLQCSTYFSCPTRVACPAHLVLLDLIILIISGEECELRSSSLCNFLNTPIGSSHWGPNIIFSTCFGNQLIGIVTRLRAGRPGFDFRQGHFPFATAKNVSSAGHRRLFLWR
jgi:hypothetical protein